MFNMAVDFVPKIIAGGKRLNTPQDKLTVYSLFKQEKDGDIDHKKASDMIHPKKLAWE